MGFKLSWPAAPMCFPAKKQTPCENVAKLQLDEKYPGMASAFPRELLRQPQR